MARQVESERFVEAARLMDEGFAIMRANLRRKYPDESEAEIDARLEAWKLDRPMDAPGRVILGALP
jgi:hypothetical protein